MNPYYLKEEMQRNHQTSLLSKENVAKKIFEMVNDDKYQSGMIVRMEDDYEYR